MIQSCHRRRGKEMSNAVILIFGEVALIAITILVIRWFLFHRSGSRKEGPPIPHEVIRSDATDTQQEWPLLAQKIASAWFVVAEGARTGAHDAVSQETTSIRRDGLCDVIPTGPGISRQHARITKQGDKSVTHDLDSTNGTFVDAKTAAASKGIALKDGNVVSVGEISLVFKEMRKGDTPQHGNARN